MSWIKSQINEDEASGISPEEIQKRIKKNLYGFNHPSLNNIKKKQKEEDDYIINPYSVEEGVVQCIKCKSWKVYSVSVQTRSSDEPMSTRSICTNCKNSWIINA